LLKMSNPTNLDIKDAACLHIVHIVQHPTSRPTQSMQTTMVNALKWNFAPLPAGRDVKSTWRSTQRRHHANEGRSGFEAGRVRGLGALGSLRSKKKLVAEKRQETHFLSNEAKRIRLRIMLSERPLGQESKLKMQRQQFSKSRIICRMLKSRD
jgi:hypothetical protein